ncbi:hypothetical protein OG21DRAFT_112174, partial [Imleria badia]
MSLSHPRAPREHNVIHYGASADDLHDQQHTETLPDSHRDIPITGRGADGTTTFVSDRTPLLQSPPPTPRLHEPAGDDVRDIAPAEQTPTANMFWEELRMLTKCSLPVFG